MDALLEREMRQRRFVANVPLHVNLVQSSSDATDLEGAKEVGGSRMSDGGRSGRDRS